MIIRASGTSATLDTRHNLLQNAGGWRGDVVYLVGTDGVQYERVRYSPYGTPYGYSFADYNMDGIIATGNQIDLNNAWSASEPAGDANGDGVYTVGDILDYLAEWTASNGNDGGEGVLSTSRGNRKGYAGYEFDGTGQAGESGIALYAHVRHRAYRTDLGRWLTQDPIGYADGMNLYEYVRGMPIIGVDPSGLILPAVVVACTALGCTFAVIACEIEVVNMFNDCRKRCKNAYGPKGTTPNPNSLDACLKCCSRKEEKDAGNCLITCGVDYPQLADYIQCVVLNAPPAAPVPGPQPKPEEPEEPDSPEAVCPKGYTPYTVQEGDSVWEVLRKRCGSPQPIPDPVDLFPDPDGRDPGSIRPGETICLPPCK